MSSVLQCIFRICCGEEEAEAGELMRRRQHQHDMPPDSSANDHPPVSRMARDLFLLGGPSSAAAAGHRPYHTYQAPSEQHVADGGTASRHDADNVEDDDEDREDLTSCCQPSSACRGPDGSDTRHPEARGILDFFHALQTKWRQRQYDTLGQQQQRSRTDTAATEAMSDLHASSSPHLFRRAHSLTTSSKPVPIPKSPLRTAATFDASCDIPTIRPEEIVLPGSLLQEQMAQSMLSQKSKMSFVENEADECVICMEGFDPTNPRMPTLCGCGENKTYFHLPCLYQWIEQCRECPSCRQPLRWEEF